jgi:hypothetical protein
MRQAGRRKGSAAELKFWKKQSTKCRGRKGNPEAVLEICYQSLPMLRIASL